MFAKILPFVAKMYAFVYTLRFPNWFLLKTYTFGNIWKVVVFASIFLFHRQATYLQF